MAIDAEQLAEWRRLADRADQWTLGDALKSKAAFPALLAEVERLRKLDADNERAINELMSERDHRVEQIEDVADALGDGSEWTNLNDRGDAAYEAACAVVAEVERLRAEVALLEERGHIDAHYMTERDAALERVAAMRAAIATFTPEIIKALRECVAVYVRTFYVDSDGNDAKPKADSPVVAALDAIEIARTL